jgi:hypothetical protein
MLKYKMPCNYMRWKCKSQVWCDEKCKSQVWCDEKCKSQVWCDEKCITLHFILNCTFSCQLSIFLALDLLISLILHFTSDYIFLHYCIYIFDVRS